MEFKELIADFAARHNVENLVAEDDAVALDIDNIIVTIAANNDAIAFSAEIGEPPVEGRADFADILLEASLESEVFFAKNREGGKYVAVRRLALATLDAKGFDAALESLLNIVETWRRMLADFRPAAKAAAEADATLPAFGNSNFMQV
jgi:hypothetical protein